MKFTGKILICLVGGLTWAANVCADDDVLPGNPYASVVTRNIFGLNPPPPVDPNAGQDATPPPKITPNGIMTIFGQLQVLFKVADTGAPGKPAGDQDYILSEGEGQDDIEVVKIDEKDGIVTFNNHGEVQELPLVAAASSGSSAGGNPASSIPTMPGGRGFGNNFGGRGGGNFIVPFGGRNRGYGNGGNNSNGLNNSPTLGNTPMRSNTFDPASQIPPGMTPETQVIMIEANRAAALQSGDADAAKILPITELTPAPSDSENNPQ